MKFSANAGKVPITIETEVLGETKEVTQTVDIILFAEALSEAHEAAGGDVAKWLDGVNAVLDRHGLPAVAAGGAWQMCEAVYGAAAQAKKASGATGTPAGSPGSPGSSPASSSTP